MNVFVTGGAGYIGSVVAEQLVASGESVVVFDNLSQGHRTAVPAEAVFFEGDLFDRAAIDAALAQHRPDAVMHFAAHSCVGDSMIRPFEYLGRNVVYGLNLLQSLVEHGVRRFILSSTASLFGVPERLPIAEDERIMPGSPYGESKYMLERTLPWLEQVYGLRYASLRYFNAAGATADHGEDHHPEQHLIPTVLRKALADGEDAVVTIFGDDYPTPDGTCVRDYIHVADLAQAHVLALRALDQQSRVYNLGNGQGFSVRQVIEAARRITGRPIPVRVGPRRPGDPPILVASSEKIRRELGWQPAFPELEQIIDSAWQWHRRNPAGYDDRAAAAVVSPK
ncbi:MAG TPA: UDP-glucose 4-epimerase GalE [Pirellulales bacterium]|nr:UDP-glucose 4-epimerase GalE [Pirellulales bacterium]